MVAYCVVNRMLWDLKKKIHHLNIKQNPTRLYRAPWCLPINRMVSVSIWRTMDAVFMTMHLPCAGLLIVGVWYYDSTMKQQGDCMLSIDWIFAYGIKATSCSKTWWWTMRKEEAIFERSRFINWTHQMPEDNFLNCYTKWESSSVRGCDEEETEI